MNQVSASRPSGPRLPSCVASEPQASATLSAAGKAELGRRRRAILAKRQAEARGEVVSEPAPAPTPRPRRTAPSLPAEPAPSRHERMARLAFARRREDVALRAAAARAKTAALAVAWIGGPPPPPPAAIVGRAPPPVRAEILGPAPAPPRHPAPTPSAPPALTPSRAPTSKRFQAPHGLGRLDLSTPHGPLLLQAPRPGGVGARKFAELLRRAARGALPFARGEDDEPVPHLQDAARQDLHALACLYDGSDRLFPEAPALEPRGLPVAGATLIAQAQGVAGASPAAACMEVA